MTKFSAPQQNQLAQIGAFLRENREKQEKSLEDIAIRTYIRPQLLNGIETGNPDTLPEPIFVQGFIRRYGEALGLNGIELSQQFTVSSIPSTPRPAPPEPLSDSATTRLTRASAPQPPAQPIGAAAAIPEIPTVRPGSAVDSAASARMDSAEALTLGRTNSESGSVADGFAPGQAQPNAAFEAQLSESTGSRIAMPEFEGSKTEAEANIPVLSSADTYLSDYPISKSAADIELEPIEEASEDQDFSSMVAAFDKENMSLGGDAAVDLARPSVESAALNEQAALNSTLGNTSFDDDLPAAFTTEAIAPATTTVPEPAIPESSLTEPIASTPTELSAPTVSHPVEMEYEDNTQTNLKPFVIGGVLAAIALLGVLIASVIGSNRQPSVVDNPESIEQAEGSSGLPPLPEETEPAEAAAPPAISDAPIYVEGTAVREAWVSVISDGETVFEEILQPGDSQLWEAEETLSIYSGDAGALELAANGAEAEVMGEAGQPDERVFP